MLKQKLLKKTESNVFLGLGSNLGNKLKYLRKAVQLINDSEGCNIIKASSVYESKPFGVSPYDNFYNAVILIETSLSPDELLMFAHFIETFLGRKHTVEKWAPREIDVDILFYNQLIYNYDDLKIPHPEIQNRDFVIIPMAEIEPDFIHPVLNVKMNQIDLSKIENNIIQKLDFSLLL